MVDEISDKYYIFPSGNSCNEQDILGKEGLLYILTFEVIPETVGQATGLKDTNGTEIYDGDIVNIFPEKAVVEYSENDSGFILKPIGEYYFDSPMLAHNKDLTIEVIENIHDNLELLEER